MKRHGAATTANARSNHEEATLPSRRRSSAGAEEMKRFLPSREFLLAVALLALVVLASAATIWLC